MHSYYEMFHGRDGHLVAALEQIGIHVKLSERKPVPFAAESMEVLERLLTSHRELPPADYAGRVIGIRRGT